ncbi:MAG: acyl carrier protein [Betaproteobacteria bacterium]|nr:acyl carrier protein [Betaproteobacteria bacterium]PWB63505.1 MAG: phosphopantetheine-binding protein [Betaproteobacteria bacterium]
MNAKELVPLLFEELRRIAPELEEGDVAPDKLLRDQVDLDSMDWLNFLIAVHQRFKVEIAESDYATLATLDQIAAYVVARNPQCS